MLHSQMARIKVERDKIFNIFGSQSDIRPIQSDAQSSVTQEFKVQQLMQKRLGLPRDQAKIEEESLMSDIHSKVKDVNNDDVPPRKREDQYESEQTSEIQLTEKQIALREYEKGAVTFLLKRDEMLQKQRKEISKLKKLKKRQP